MMQSNITADNAGHASIAMLNQLVFQLLVTSAAEGNYELLEDFDIDRELANKLCLLKAGALQNELTGGRSCLFSITPNTNFKSCVEKIVHKQTEEGIINDLYRVGATLNMLQDLGFGITRAEYSEATNNALCASGRGRPGKLDIATIRQCHEYWKGPRGLIDRDPIHLLIETCEAFEIRAASLWAYIGPDALKDEISSRPYALKTKASRRPWAQIMLNHQYGSKRTEEQYGSSGTRGKRGSSGTRGKSHDS